MRREERGVAGKARVMLTAREADCGRGRKHISVQVTAWSTANGWQPIMGSRNEKHLTPGTEAGWFCRQNFLSDG